MAPPACPGLQCPGAGLEKVEAGPRTRYIQCPLQEGAQGPRNGMIGGTFEQDHLLPSAKPGESGTAGGVNTFIFHDPELKCEKTVAGVTWDRKQMKH